MIKKYLNIYEIVSTRYAQMIHNGPRFWALSLLLIGMLQSGTLLSQNEEASNRIQLLSDSAWKLESVDPFLAIKMYDQVIELCDSVGDGLAEGKNIRYKALTFKAISDFNAAQFWMERADSLLSLQTDTVEMAKAKFSLATIHQFQGNTGTAARFYGQALDLFTLLDDQTAISKCASNLGVLYYELMMYEEAEEYDSIAVHIARNIEGGGESLCSSLINWGVAQAKREKSEQAKANYLEALELAVQLDDRRLIAYAHTNLADYYALKGQFDEALLYSEKALGIAQKEGFEIEEASFLHQYGYLLEQTGNPEGLAFMNQAFDLNQRLGLRSDRVPLLEHLSEVYAKKKNFFRAYNYAVELRYLKDSISSESTIKMVNDLRVQYESTEKERENVRLKHARAMDEVEHEKSQTKLFSVIAFLLLLLVLSIVGVLSYRSKLEANKTIALQQKALDEKKIQELKNQQTIRSLDDMLQGQQEERQRIAKDLHDGLGGLLSTIQMHFNRIQDELDAMKKLDAHSQAFNLLDEACSEVRKIAHDMMPSSLERLGLFSAVSDLLHQLERGMEITVIPQQFGEPIKLDAGKATMIYRIAQEVIANSIKHAKASQLIVQFNWHQSDLKVVIEDDGVGFDEEKIEKGLGLKSIDSRVKYVDGEWNVESSIGEGTSVNFTFPFKSIAEKKSEDD